MIKPSSLIIIIIIVVMVLNWIWPKLNIESINQSMNEFQNKNRIYLVCRNQCSESNPKQTKTETKRSFILHFSSSKRKESIQYWKRNKNKPRKKNESLILEAMHTKILNKNKKEMNPFESIDSNSSNFQFLRLIDWRKIWIFSKTNCKFHFIFQTNTRTKIATKVFSNRLLLVAKITEYFKHGMNGGISFSCLFDYFGWISNLWIKWIQLVGFVDFYQSCNRLIDFNSFKRR